MKYIYTYTQHSKHKSTHVNVIPLRHHQLAYLLRNMTGHAWLLNLAQKGNSSRKGSNDY